MKYWCMGVFTTYISFVFAFLLVGVVIGINEPKECPTNFIKRYHYIFPTMVLGCKLGYYLGEDA